jgi:predicted dehydrogenase
MVEMPAIIITCMIRQGGGHDDTGYCTVRYRENCRDCLCSSRADGRRSSGITFAMGYNNRFNSGLQRIKAVLDAGDIGPVRYARALLTSQVQNPKGWRALGEQSRYWALSATGTHLIDCWRWYFGEPTSVGGGLTTPRYGGPNDEVSTLVLNYPGRLLAELTATAILRGGNRLELFGEAGTIIGENVFGSRPRDTSIMCNGQAIACQAADSFVGEVTDFVQAIRQQRQSRATLEDGLRNVHIMETARDGILQRPV